MANMASVAYAIEGPEIILKRIKSCITKAIKTNDTYWTEYTACTLLGIPRKTLEDKRLGGEISEEPYIDKSHHSLRFCAEERWGLQDFNDILKEHFPELIIYWSVEELGNGVYTTNDKGGKYFFDRFYCELWQDDQCVLEYFSTEDSMYKWLSKQTQGRVYDAPTVEKFNRDYEETGDDGENYISIYQCKVVDD